jgi:hypothetical protein
MEILYQGQQGGILLEATTSNRAMWAEQYGDCWNYVSIA